MNGDSSFSGGGFLVIDIVGVNTFTQRYILTCFLVFYCFLDHFQQQVLESLASPAGAFRLIFTLLPTSKDEPKSAYGGGYGNASEKAPSLGPGGSSLVGHGEMLRSPMFFALFSTEEPGPRLRKRHDFVDFGLNSGPKNYYVHCLLSVAWTVRTLSGAALFVPSRPPPHSLQEIHITHTPLRKS